MKIIWYIIVVVIYAVIIIIIVCWSLVTHKWCYLLFGNFVEYFYAAGHRRWQDWWCPLWPDIATGPTQLGCPPLQGDIHWCWNWLRGKNTNKSINIRENRRPDGLTSSTTILTLGPEIGPLGHIIEIHLKVPPINVQNKNDAKPVENISNPTEPDAKCQNMPPLPLRHLLPGILQIIPGDPKYHRFH